LSHRISYLKTFMLWTHITLVFKVPVSDLSSNFLQIILHFVIQLIYKFPRGKWRRRINRGGVSGSRCRQLLHFWNSTMIVLLVEVPYVNSFPLSNLKLLVIWEVQPFCFLTNFVNAKTIPTTFLYFHRKLDIAICCEALKTLTLNNTLIFLFNFRIQWIYVLHLHPKWLGLMMVKIFEEYHF